MTYPAGQDICYGFFTIMLTCAQFANAFFTTENKIKIATMLSDFGADYIELTSPVSSEKSYEDCKTICNLGLKVCT